MYFALGLLTAGVLALLVTSTGLFIELQSALNSTCSQKVTSQTQPLSHFRL